MLLCSLNSPKMGTFAVVRVGGVVENILKVN